jgi:pimeloyl-ACP methyl ester carboxylesterase
MQEWTMDEVPEATFALAGIRRIDYRSGRDGLADWALARPPAKGGIWLVCLHGHGSHGDQLYTRRDIRERWLPEFLDRGLGVLTPNRRDNAWMGPAAVADLDDLLGLVRAEFGASAFLFASGSMGGTGNLIYAALRPQNVAGVIARGAATDLSSYHAWCRERQADKPVLGEIADAIAMSYGGVPEAVPASYAAHSALALADRLTMPLFLSHGAADAVIPVSQMRALVGRLAHHPRLVYQEIPDGNHDSPLHARTTPHALDWLLARL